MSELRLWPIWVEHPVSRERMKVLGQGHTVVEALNDAAKTIQIPFRPKNDGKERNEPTCAVITASGLPACRTIKEFESGVHYDRQ